MKKKEILLMIKYGWPMAGALIVGTLIGYILFHNQSDSVALPVNNVALMESQEEPAKIDPGLILPFASNNKHMNADSHDNDQKLKIVEENPIYICPMNCIAPMKKPGRCPVCGMDLVEHDVGDHSTGTDELSAMPKDGGHHDHEHDAGGHAGHETDGHNMHQGDATSHAMHEDSGHSGKHNADQHQMMHETTDMKTKGESSTMPPAHHHHGGLSAGEGPAVVKLTTDMIQKAGIRVAAVEEKLVSAKIRLYGKIEYDPVDQYKITAFTPGVVDNVYIRRAGQAVRRGDPLFDLHSAELYYLEQELIKILEKLPYTFDVFPSKGHVGKRSGRWSKPLYPTAPGKSADIDPELSKEVRKSINLLRRKMRLLGLSEKDIDLVIRRAQPTGIATITTPMTGIILEQNAYRGAFVNTGDVIFTIANPRVLWVRLNAYASDFPWIRLGQKATFETDAYPGKTFEGKVVNIDPEFDAVQRTFRVGVLYHDKKGLLKPNMLVRSIIHAELKTGGQSATEVLTTGMMNTPQMKRTNKAPLVIPETAPLITGERSVVYVQVPDQPNTFVGREVILGPRAEGYYVVQSGLHKGELVVVNGNFKIDSAIQIMARTSMMSRKEGQLPTAYYNHVKTPPADEIKANHQSKSPAPVGRGSQHNIYRGYRDKVQ